jgi:hypothetical protein
MLLLPLLLLLPPLLLGPQGVVGVPQAAVGVARLVAVVVVLLVVHRRGRCLLEVVGVHLVGVPRMGSALAAARHLHIINVINIVIVKCL